MRAVVNQEDVGFFLVIEVHSLNLVINIRLLVHTVLRRSRYALGHHLIIRMRSMGRELRRLHIGVSKVFLIDVIALF